MLPNRVRYIQKFNIFYIYCGFFSVSKYYGTKQDSMVPLIRFTASQVQHHLCGIPVQAYCLLLH